MKHWLLSLPALAVATPFALSPRQSGIRITSISTGGTGCPPGSVFSIINGTGDIAEVEFTEFTILAENNTPVNNKDLSCDIAFAMSFSGTCKQAVVETRTHGYITLAQAADATARFINRFAFSGGIGGDSPPDLEYQSQPVGNLEVDIDRRFNVSVEATGETATFIARFSVFLNVPDAGLRSQIETEGTELIVHPAC